ncbi:trypsin-like peptidase domain-containing protein [Nocardia terpenica]|uniref:S1C family serine protease n=1 Tax=Nocardia terpenica TaxID=455432 RepID=UPI0018960C54|nr:trypsin-like peptidase domain-containing protein [Nocardia terpenica]MBF6060851.1 trypsin-like peptidase domain-containing protein [Nocardia terpenica]MBF6104111.1 trypsin-like peptidase domain-containing protein [Nocardia terpenica]MBF6111515.1 trypsin-like peptidase domain-containing protein [Nocardia terpenica]MBF6118332.1 trypsin-like peptidase domain-containing protein [Nocardia terpenica]MBF6155654.1 trypsin-like peptidase domain-containing protein [Nocardia terpenica]
MTTESTNSGSQSAADDKQSAVPDSAANRGNLRPPDAPVLGPRPVDRPHIDQPTEHAFRRPEGAQGPFAAYTPGQPTPQHDGPELVNRPPDAVLAEAFGRPAGSTEYLQRDPEADDDTAEPITPADPWRDPEAAARLGAPAVSVPPAAPLPPAPRLTAREVLFGGRVSPRALLVLGVVALLIGLVGGLVGRLTAEATAPLTSRKVALQQESAPDKPHGQVAKVADAVLPSVVLIRETVGDNGALGSGVVVDGNGYIVTNNHVISMAAMDKTGKAKIQVTFSDGTRVPAKLVGRDPKTDLAVLKVDVKNLTVIRLGKSGDVRVGDDVLAVGAPLGLAQTVTSGIVSALDRASQEPLVAGDDSQGAFYAVQTDAAINHGNSGGALIDMQGRLIGINTMIKTENGGSVGLGFAIPVDLVQKVSQTLIRDGVVRHPWLGVSARTKQVENDAMSGAGVADVAANSPAARAGIAEGDVIVKVGDREVTTPEELSVAVQSHEIGERVNFQVIRDGRQVDVPVTLESDQNAPKQPQ